MKKTLYLKFILAYLIFGFFGFIIITTFSNKMITENLKRDKASALYREALLISSSYANKLYENKITLETAKAHIDSVSTYMSATVWIMNPSGRVLLDSSSPIDLENPVMIKDFDPTEKVGSYYTVSNFYGAFDQKVISAYAPITSDFKVKGYVVIHYPMSSLEESVNSLLNICFITLVILFLLSLIILKSSAKPTLINKMIVKNKMTSSLFNTFLLKYFNKM